MPDEALDDDLPPPRSLDELAALQHVVPVTSLDELAVDLWESDGELDAFLDDVRRSRHAANA